MLRKLKDCLSNHSFHKVDSRIPIIGKEVRVPLGFIEATTIDGPNPAIHAINAELVWRKSDYAAKSLMSSMYCLIFKTSVSFPEYPRRGYTTGEVRIGYFRKWRYKDGV